MARFTAAIDVDDGCELVFAHAAALELPGESATVSAAIRAVRNPGIDSPRVRTTSVRSTRGVAQTG